MISGESKCYAITSTGTSKFVSLLPYQEAGVVHQADVAELPLCGQYTSELASFQLPPFHLTAVLGFDGAVSVDLRQGILDSR